MNVRLLRRRWSYKPHALADRLRQVLARWWPAFRWPIQVARKAFMLESIEPRLLLSADVSFAGFDGTPALVPAGIGGHLLTRASADFGQRAPGDGSTLVWRTYGTGDRESSEPDVKVLEFAFDEAGELDVRAHRTARTGIDLSDFGLDLGGIIGARLAVAHGLASASDEPSAGITTASDVHGAGDLESAFSVTQATAEGEIQLVSDAKLTVDAAAVPAPAPFQLFVLDTDGAYGLDYGGPVTVDGIDVPSFFAPWGLAGQESVILSSLVDSLNASFTDLGAQFTTDLPDEGAYSTIYLGGDGSWFSEWGSYYGIAEQIDLGNQDQSDFAFVFTESIAAAAASASHYADLLAEVVAHEAGHLLGFAHDLDVGGGPLGKVAFDPKVHVEIGKDAVAELLDPAHYGKVIINGAEYTVHPKLVAAFENWMPYYNAGAVGGDGFPDVVMGQFAIHPIEHATWLTRVLDMAWAVQDSPWYTEDEKGQILAWSYGLVTHSAGDHFAHTLVNEFAEGVAPGFFAAGASIGTDQRDLGNMLRHIMTEAYIADAMEGVDTNPEITQLVADPGDSYTVAGDWSSVSTPGIEFAAPTRFIYEALLRPFADDPTAIAEMKWKSGTLAIENGNQFVRGEGKWTEAAELFGDGDGFKVGHKITVSGFADPANNGTFIVTAVTDKVLTVDAALVNEAASGDEKIRVFVPHTGVTTITVNDADNTFTRAEGSFKDDGFVDGQRFTV